MLRWAWGETACPNLRTRRYRIEPIALSVQIPNADEIRPAAIIRDPPGAKRGPPNHKILGFDGPLASATRCPSVRLPAQKGRDLQLILAPGCTTAALAVVGGGLGSSGVTVGAQAQTRTGALRVVTGPNRAIRLGPGTAMAVVVAMVVAVVVAVLLGAARTAEPGHALKQRRPVAPMPLAAVAMMIGFVTGRQAGFGRHPQAGLTQRRSTRRGLLVAGLGLAHLVARVQGGLAAHRRHRFELAALDLLMRGRSLAAQGSGRGARRGGRRLC
jgi:hypothetical protein